MTGFAIVAVENGTALVLPDGAFTARQRAAITHILSNRGVDPLPASPEGPARALVTGQIAPAAPVPNRDRVAASNAARAEGLSGMFCSRCSSARTKQNGTCLICLDCHETTGCS